MMDFAVAVAHATNFNGPWDIRPLRIVDHGIRGDSDEHLSHTNPSPAVLPNGTLVIAFNGGHCNPGGTANCNINANVF